MTRKQGLGLPAFSWALATAWVQQDQRMRQLLLWGVYPCSKTKSRLSITVMYQKCAIRSPSTVFKFNKGHWHILLSFLYLDAGHATLISALMPGIPCSLFSVQKPLQKFKFTYAYCYCWHIIFNKDSWQEQLNVIGYLTVIYLNLKIRMPIICPQCYIFRISATSCDWHSRKEMRCGFRRWCQLPSFGKLQVCWVASCK